MRLWLFSNVGYGFGESVWRRSADEAAARGWRCTLVLSARRPLLAAEKSAAATARSMARRVRQRRRLRSAAGFRRVVIVKNVNSRRFLARVRNTDVALIAGFDQVLSPSALAAFREVVNIHPSVLPLYRGPVPSRWVVANGELATGYAVHTAVRKVDAGRVLMNERVDVPTGATEAEVDALVSERASRRAPEILSALAGELPWPGPSVAAGDVYHTPVAYAGFDSQRLRPPQTAR